MPEVALALASDWARQFARLLESMTGDPARASVVEPPAGAPLVWWEQQLMSGLRTAHFAIGIEPEICRFLGGELLRAAGIEDATVDDARRTCFEAIAEVTAGAARTLSSRFGAEVRCEGGAQAAAPSEPARFGIVLSWRGRDFPALGLAVGPELEALEPRAVPAADTPALPAAPNPKTLDLLIEVELPVTVSFGSARMPLKDVLRLSSGSIIELNRDASEPVDIIVNNCMIARGEVVVVEGNYGVRIKEIASRQERLKSVS